MKTKLPVSLVLSVVVVVGGCSRGGLDADAERGGQAVRTKAAARERALVRFVNADPTQVGLEFWLEKERVFSSVAFRNVTTYQELPASRQMFSIRTPGQMQELATNSEGLTDGRRYTFVAVRKADGGTSLRVTEDDLSAPATGRAKVRLFHAAPGAGELRLMPAQGSKPKAVFEDVDFETATGFKEIGPSITGFVLYREDQKEPALQLSKLNLQAERFYTLIITGAKGTLEEPIRIEDALSGPVVGQVTP
jgi:hypothetical protein